MHGIITKQIFYKHNGERVQQTRQQDSLRLEGEFEGRSQSKVNGEVRRVSETTERMDASKSRSESSQSHHEEFSRRESANKSKSDVNKDVKTTEHRAADGSIITRTLVTESRTSKSASHAEERSSAMKASSERKVSSAESKLYSNKRHSEDINVSSSSLQNVTNLI